MFDRCVTYVDQVVWRLDRGPLVTPEFRIPINSSVVTLRVVLGYERIHLASVLRKDSDRNLC
jgi:hypothetical protein